MTSSIEPRRDLPYLRASVVKLETKSGRRKHKNSAAIGQREDARESGFHMPAEWESHEATWLGWPQNRTDWPGKFATIPWVYGEIVRKLTPGEMLRIIVNSPAVEARARR